MRLDGAARLRRFTLPAALSLTFFALILVGMHAPARKRPATPPAPPPAPLPLAGVTLVLDPGHGGVDSGTVRHGDAEAALTYRTAVELADCVRRAGGTVIYTVRSRALDPALAVTEPPPTLPRDAVLVATGEPLRLRRGDTPRPLWARAAVARPLQASRARAPRSPKNTLFFLSLHYDEYPLASVHGALVCVDRRAGMVSTFARTLAASLCADGLARRDRYEGLRGVSARHLGVLDPLYNPVPERVLLELATISNPADADAAADPAWRRAMAARITAALIATHNSPSL